MLNEWAFSLDKHTSWKEGGALWGNFSERNLLLLSNNVTEEVPKTVRSYCVDGAEVFAMSSTTRWALHLYSSSVVGVGFMLECEEWRYAASVTSILLFKRQAVFCTYTNPITAFQLTCSTLGQMQLVVSLKWAPSKRFPGWRMRGEVLDWSCNKNHVVSAQCWLESKAVLGKCFCCQRLDKKAKVPPISQVFVSITLCWFPNKGTHLAVLLPSLIYAVPLIPLVSLSVQQHDAMHIHNNINLPTDRQI